MTSVLYILNEDLEPLIHKNVKSIPFIDYPIQQFKKLYNPRTSPPILNYNDQLIFVYIRRDSLLFLSVVDRFDSFLMEILSYLEQFYHLLKDYFNVKSLNKNVIIDNSTLVLELVDESMDFGAIQVTDSGIMKDYIRIKVNLPEMESLANVNADTDESSCSSCESISDNDMDFSANGADPNKGKHKHKHKHNHKHKHKSDKKKEKEIKKIEKTRKEMEDLTKKVVGTLKSDPLSIIDKSGLTKGNKNKIEDFIEGQEEENTYMNSDIARTTVMRVSWRTKGIHYGKNEFFLDVIEKLEYYMDFTNNIIRKNLIHGEIYCKSFLSGMPTLKISINKIINKDQQFLSNCKFHQCVSLESVENGKEIEFIPPDGNFTLCKYELKRHVRDQPMIKLVSFEIKPKPKKFKLKMYVTIESHFKTTNSTSKLNLKIPIKQILHDWQVDLSKNLRFKCDQGQILFNVSDDFLLWEIGPMKGGHGETQLSVGIEFSLFNKEEFDRQQEELKTSMNPPPLRTGPKLEELYKQVHEEEMGKEEEEEPNTTHTIEEEITSRNVASVRDKDRLLNIDFEVPYCTSSGLKVEYLKIEEPQLQYQSFPWVRYKTLSDSEYAYLIY